MWRRILPANANGWILLVVFLAIGAGIRFINIGEESFWIDEVFSARIVDKPIGQIIDLIPPDKPPLEYYVQALFTLLGEPETWNRMPAAIFGMITLLGIYAWAAALLGRRAGLMALALASTNTLLVYYSREARPYSMFTALCTWQMFFFYQWFRVLRCPRMKFPVGLTIGLYLTSQAFIYTLYAGLVTLGCQMLFLLGWLIYTMTKTSPAQRKRATIAAGTFLLMIGITLLAALPLRGRAELYDETFFWKFQGINYGLYAWLTRSFMFNATAGTPDSLSLLIFPLMIAGVWYLARRRRAFAVYLLVVALIPVYLFPFLYAHLNRIITMRYVIFAAPAMVIVYVYGLRALAGLAHRELQLWRIRTSVIAIMWILIGLLMAGSAVAHIANRPNRHNWRDALRTIADEAQSGDRVVVPGGFHLVPTTYYLQRFGRDDLEIYKQAEIPETPPEGGVWIVGMAMTEEFHDKGIEGIMIEHRRNEFPATPPSEMMTQLSQPNTVGIGTAPQELLGPGWGTSEDWGNGLVIRWAEAKTATVYMPLEEKTPGTLTIRVMPYQTDKFGAQGLTLIMNGHGYEMRQLPNHMADVSWELPASILRQGYNRIDMEFAWTLSPSTERESYGDFRTLAAAIEYIRWEPAITTEN